jgi:hypothetical protein
VTGTAVEYAGLARDALGYSWPPVPISPAQSERIGRLFASFPERREEELDVWERTLNLRTPPSRKCTIRIVPPSFSTQSCSECDLARGVVISEKILEASARMAGVKCNRDVAVARAERRNSRR